MIIHKDSHTDHAINSAQWHHILDVFGDRTGFFIETIELPRELGVVLNRLYGPSCGDEPIPESEVYYAPRPPRTWNSRMTKMSARPTRFIRVIAGPHETTCTTCEGKILPLAKEGQDTFGWSAGCDHCSDTGKLKFECVLYTAYGVASKDMPAAPKEPGDLQKQIDEVLATKDQHPVSEGFMDDKLQTLWKQLDEAKEFWAQHALATEAP